MELVTIKTFDSITSLGITQSYLDSEGIESYVKDEFMGQVYAGAGVDSFKIKLQVEQKDVEQAIKLLIEGGFAKPEDYEVDKTMLKLSRFLDKVSNLFKRK